MGIVGRYKLHTKNIWLMKFKEWWLTNKVKITKISNFWLLPKKLKIIVRIIIAAIDIYITSDADDTIASVALKDVTVSHNVDDMYFKNKENVA